MALIEREAALKILHENPMGTRCGTPVYSAEIKAAIQEIEDLPTIDATPVVYGRWINPHWRNSTSCAHCSECGAEACHREYRGVQKYYKICPNCGARMDGGDGYEAG